MNSCSDANSTATAGWKLYGILKRRLCDVVYRAMLADQNQSLSAVA
ncbi:MAG: hypothetical protein ACLPPT_09765 [Mycobacterium sp.]